MFTLATLTQAIKDYTENDESTFVSQIPTFIQLAEERVFKSVQLEEFQDTSYIEITSGTRCVDKPCDWLSTYTLTLRHDDTPDERVLLQNKDSGFLDDYWPDYVSTGTPRYYADHDNTRFVIAPTPDVAYTVILHYLRRPESLVDAPTPTWLATNAPQALLYGTLVEAYGYMKGQLELLQFYDTRFTESLMRMKNHGEGLEPDDSLRRGFIRTQPT